MRMPSKTNIAKVKNIIDMLIAMCSIFMLFFDLHKRIRRMNIIFMRRCVYKKCGFILVLRQFPRECQVTCQ